MLLAALIGSTSLSSPPTSAALEPPSIAWPDYSVSGGTTTVTVADGRTALKNAIAAGGTIQLEAGTYDLTGWTTQALDGVKLVGAGKDQTILRCNFDNTSDYSSGPTAIFGSLTGRLVCEGVTFENWRGVFMGNGAGYFRAPDGNIIDNAIANDIGDVYDAGFALRDVAIRSCGYAMYYEDKGMSNFSNRCNNIFLLHCDIEDVWIAVNFLSGGGSSNWMIYNCYFRDCIIPGEPGQAEWGNVAPGIFNALNHNSLSETPIDGQDIRIEHCTFNGIGCRATRTDNTFPACVMRFTGLVGGSWVKRCLFQNLGFDSAGNYANTHPSDAELLYLKCGDFDLEDIVVLNSCIGGEAILGGKGGIDSGTEYRSYNITNWYHDGQVGMPLSEVAYWESSRNTRQGDYLYAKAHFGHSRFNNHNLQNITLKNCKTEKGFFAEPGWSQVGHVRDVTYRDITIDNCEHFYEDSAFIRPAGGGAANLPTTFTFDNILITNTPDVTEAVFIHPAGDTDYQRIDATNIRLELVGSATNASLVFIDEPISTIGSITGEIIGNADNKYSRRGYDTSDTPLGSYSGTVTGATASITEDGGAFYRVMDWGVWESFVGCAAR